MTIYTRIRYCPECAENFRPHLGDWYLKHDGDSLQFCQVSTEVHKDEFGLVPHQIQLESSISRNIVYRAVCAMDGCGVQMTRDENGKMKLFDKQGRIITAFEGKFYYKEKGLYYQLPEDENVFHRSVRIKEPSLETCAHADWNALLKSECEL